MKKILSVLVIAVMLVAGVFLLTGCGEKESANNGGGTAVESKQGENVKSSELFDVSDDKIVTNERDEDYHYTKVTGDKRTRMLNAIPAEMKKAIGEIETVNVQTPGGQGTYTLSIRLKLSGDNDYAKLTDYYKSLNGTVTGDLDSKYTKTFYMDFDWGKIFQCEYDKEDKTLQVSISIN